MGKLTQLKGCAEQFYGCLAKFFQQENPCMPINSLFQGGEAFWVFGGGADFIYVGAGIFLGMTLKLHTEELV